MEKTASTPIQLFRGMTADELAALRAAHCTRVQRYDKNALIYHAGRVVHEIGIVQSGSVNVESNDLWGNKSILSHVEAGQAFAETYALCGEPLMVDVAAAEPCEILWLDLVPMLQQQNTAASWYPKFFAQPVTAFYAEKPGALPTHPVHHTKKCAWAAADLSFRAGSAGGQHAFFHPV